MSQKKQDIIWKKDIPNALRRSGEYEAIALLREYFSVDDNDFPILSGAMFGHLSPESTETDKFTFRDINEVSMLSISISGSNSLKLTYSFEREEPTEIWQSLAKIEKNVFFAETSGEKGDSDIDALYDLYDRLDKLKGLGQTSISKLLAVKRPHLAPVVDTWIKRELFEEKYVNRLWYSTFNRELHKYLNATEDGITNAKWLDSLKSKALEPNQSENEPSKNLESMSTIRTFDVIVWMSHLKRRERESARKNDA